ncbi:tRNA methyltransferase 10 homolog C-like [Patiria miniata]|uniref:RNA (guanine-9-)-methyltransferase domain-containing protein 1 n=1 Tax=Patiria miniata TaxID=46514 RepID=A0A914AFX8_PATMI|nr:tRNA methyltransferase 10 homolog C-like [Patiria miniata]
MFPWLRSCRYLAGPRCLSSAGKGIDRNLTKQLNLCHRNFLHSPSLQKSHTGNVPYLAKQHLHRSTTLVCKCSTVSHSEPDDGMRSEEEKSREDGETKMEGGGTDEPARVTAARLELEVMRSAGSNVPEYINEFDLDYFSTLNSKKSRKRFLAFLFKKEMLRLKDREKRRLAREERESEEPKVEEDLDAPMKNRLFLQLQPQSVLQFDNWHLAAGMKFGPKLVYDFSYEEHMRRPELISMVQQLMHGVGANKLARDPFDVHWAGLQAASGTMREMRRMLGEHLGSVMVNVTDRQVQDAFPVEDIVYLTADSPNIMRSYNPNKVYVIGALVDSHRILRGVSFAKAKRLNLNHARLPLDLFLKWSSGGKNLTLDQMMQILIELNTSGDWVKALNHVPTRKHMGLKSERPAEQLNPDSQERRTFKKSPPQQEARFSSSRAKNSRSWPTLDEPTFNRSKSVNSATVRQRVRQIIDEEEDPANETIFSSAGGYGSRKTTTPKSNPSDKQWFED